MATEPAHPRNALPLELHFELTLRRGGPGPAWHAELAAPGAGQRLHFESLLELTRYLAQLDRQAPATRGIR